MPIPLSHTLKAKARAAEHKRQMIFDDIHILIDHYPSLLSHKQIAEELAKKVYIESKADALRWLREYKEKQKAKAEEDYLAQLAGLSGEIEEINKILAKMENRNG